tara:strand:- start:561 stop:755 length:195 start_codon:yes stop_codon:yes gene_type:complete
MKLSNIQLELDWPKSVEVKDLNSYIINNLSKKGEIIRWSINEINILGKEKMHKKVLIINALVLD